MKVINKLVYTPYEPKNTHVLWLDSATRKIKIFGKDGWEELFGKELNDSNTDLDIIPNSVLQYVTVDGKVCNVHHVFDLSVVANSNTELLSNTYDDEGGRLEYKGLLTQLSGELGSYNPYFSKYIMDIILPEGMQIIGMYFCGTEGNDTLSLERITIPSSVHTIEQYAFNACPYLNEIVFKGTCALWKKITKAEYAFENVTIDKVTCEDGQAPLI